MKLIEIEQKMQLLEILNTQPEGLVWSVEQGYRNIGKFTLDNIVYTINLDEFSALRKDVVDFGFTREGKVQAIQSGKPASRVIGAVVNGVTSKIEKLNPDVIIVSVLKGSGLEDSRKSLYSTMIKFIQKRTQYFYTSDWMENSKAFHMILAKDTPTPEELEIVVKQATNK